MKKLIVLIMMVIMALSVGGCGRQTPDYSFYVQEFVHDCFYNHGSTFKDSLSKACKYYENKLINLSQLVVLEQNKDYAKFRTLVAGENPEFCVKFKDKADVEKFEFYDVVEISARFKDVTFEGKDDGGHLYFNFYDGEFLSKEGNALTGK